MGEITAPATAPRTRQAYDVVVRPRPALVRSTVLSIVFSAVPLAVALLWVTFPSALWAVVVVVVLLLAALVATVFVRLGTAFVGVGPDTVTVRTVARPTRSVLRSTVHRVLVATTSGSSVDRTVRELVAFDADGTALLHLRADLWGDDGLDRVVEALDVRSTQLPRTVAARDFARQYPTSRGWWERRVAYVVVGGFAALLVCALLAVETVGFLPR